MSLLARLMRTLALLRDPRVGKLPRIAVVAALLYTAWPMDLLPDFAAPVVGYLDDLTLLWLSLRWLRRNDPDRPSSDRLAATPPR